MNQKKSIQIAREKISPAAWILFILFLTGVLVVTYLYWEKKVETNKLQKYVELTERFAMLISVLVGIYLVQFYFEQGETQERRQTASEVEKGIIDIQKLFLEPHLEHDLKHLYFEMNPHLRGDSIQDDHHIITQTEYIRGDSIQNDYHIITQKEYIVGNIVFRNIESVLDSLGKKIYQPKFLEWTQQWKIWMSSPTLQSIWKVCQNQYSQNMIEFVNKQLI